MSLFSSLDKMGLGDLSELHVFEEKKPVEAQPVGETEEKVIPESDYLYDKTYQCPLCENDIKTKTVRAGKAKLMKIDPDLRPRFQGIDTVKYDCVVCQECGYAVLTRFFGPVLPKAAKSIKENITPRYKRVDYPNDTYSYEEALSRYELVLLNAIVRNGKSSERAYICLKITWILKEMLAELDKSDKEYDAKRMELLKKINEYTKTAYEGFSVAQSTERSSICGMDEYTFTYLLAELACRCHDFGVCGKLVSELLLNRAVSAKLKDRTRVLKDRLKIEIMREKEAAAAAAANGTGTRG